MKYFPILDELFSSDSILFLMIGLVIAVLIGVRRKAAGTNLIGMTGSFIVYVLCEGISNAHTNYFIELLLLFVGTAAIGSFLGFLIGFIVSKARRSPP